MSNGQVINQRLSRWLAGMDGLPGLYLVGGTVRDLLLGRVPADIDLACCGAKGLAGRLAALHGAALVAMEKKPQQPCYRVLSRADSADYLDIAELRGATIADDLRLRDFTINAMALELSKDGSCGAFIDPLGGVADLGRKVIRMTSPQVFYDDPLRVLRAFRFAAEPGFGIESATAEAASAASVLLQQVSVERITAELFLIFRTAPCSPTVAALDRYGVLEIIFPEMTPMKGCAQNGYHHKDVWGHALLALEHIEVILDRPADYFGDTAAAVMQNLESGNRLALLKWAALFHDIGKPATQGLKATGRITFKKHDDTGAEIVRLMAERIKLSSQARAFMVLLVREHLQPLFLSAAGVTTAAHMRLFRRLGDDVVPVFVLAMADVMSSQGPESGQAYRDGFIRWCGQMVADYYASAKKILAEPRLVSGHDLIELGIAPGPAVGDILAQVHEAQDSGAVTSRDEALALAEKLMAEGM